MGSAPSSFDNRTPPPGDPKGPRLDSLLGMLPALKVLIGLMIAALVILGLYYGRELLIPIALAGFLAFLLDPAVSRLKRWGLPRPLAVGLVSVIALGVLAGAGTYLGYQLRGLSQSLPQYQDTIRAKGRALRSELKGPSMWDGALSTINTVQNQIEQTGKSSKKEPEQVQRVVIEQYDDSPKAALQAWLDRIGGTLATIGIVALLVILILIDRDSLRDRMLRLTGGGNLHMATDALQEATERIGRYLRMQLIVNASYGVPMAVGLWLIGVPAAPLWGVLATLLRFVPYIGPLISAAFPLLLAFAVDPGWNMVLWTAGLIIVLELIVNNIIEPWLYGSSTGLSTLSLIVAATFWTSLWGPIGLILSTPLTVCLLVLGRYVPSLGFFEALLGNVAVLDPPQKLYQRLLADDVEEAVEMATDRVDAACKASAVDDDREATADAVLGFYNDVALPTLRLASSQHLSAATAQHRLRFANGMDALLKEMQDEYPVAPATAPGPRVYCVGARWEVDSQAARMVAHALALHDIAAIAVPQPVGAGLSRDAAPILHAGDVVCISSFHPQPQAVLRQISRRLHRLLPTVQIIGAPWSLPSEALAVDGDEPANLQANANDLHALLLLVQGALGADEVPSAKLARDLSSQRAAALARAGVLAHPQHRELMETAVRQAANAFDVPYAQVTWLDGDQAYIAASLVPKTGGTRIPVQQSASLRVLEEDATLVVTDLSRDPRIAKVPGFQEHGVAFYAGTPLLDADDNMIGCLSILDDAPRTLSETETTLLEKMASDLMRSLSDKPA